MIPKLTEVFLVEWEPKVVKGGGQRTPKVSGHLSDVDRPAKKGQGKMIDLSIGGTEELRVLIDAIDYVLETNNMYRESDPSIPKTSPYVNQMRVLCSKMLMMSKPGTATSHPSHMITSFRMPDDAALDVLAGVEFIETHGEDEENVGVSRRLKDQLSRQSVKGWWK